jgi:Flp pilus assembly protein TadD
VKAGKTKNRAAGKGGNDPLLALARAQVEEGRFAEAEATARRLVAVAPGNAEAQVLLGEALRRRGRLNDAVLSFRAALAIDPGHALAHYLMGLALRDAKRSAEAEFAFQDAVAANPGLAEAHPEIGNLHLGQRQTAEAGKRGRFPFLGHCHRSPFALPADRLPASSAIKGWRPLFYFSGMCHYPVARR